MEGIEANALHAELEADGEFRRAARQWTGSFAFADEEGFLRIELAGGGVSSVSAAGGPAQADVVFHGPGEGWRKVFAEVPPPYYQDLVGGAVGREGFSVSGDLAAMAAHYAAISRAARLVGVLSRRGVTA